MDTVNRLSNNAKNGPAIRVASPETGRPRSVSICTPRGAIADPKVRSKSLEPTSKVDSLLSDFDQSLKDLAIRRGCPKEPRACPKAVARSRGRSPIRRECVNQEPGDEYNGENNEEG